MGDDRATAPARDDLFGASWRAWALVGTFVAAYLSWQWLRWLPVDQVSAADAWFMPLGVAGVVVTWRKGRRAGREEGVRRAWQLVSLAWLAYLLGAIAEAAYGAAGPVPYPSAADIGFLAFYPLGALGLLRFPARRSVRSHRLTFVLDLLTVAIGTGAFAWYFVLGPYVVNDGHGLLTAATTVAYSVGDGLLAMALMSRILRGTPGQARPVMAMLGVGVLLFVAGDLVYQYLNQHGAYHSGGPVDILWMCAQALIVLAAVAQSPTGEADDEPQGSAGRVGWLPYLAVGVALVLSTAAEIEDSFFPHVSLLLMVGALVSLLIARQVLTQRTARAIERQLALVATLGRHGLATSELGELLTESTAAVARELGVEYCTVLRLEPDQEQLRIIAGFGWPANTINNLVIPSSTETHAGYTLLADAPVVVADLRDDPRFTDGAIALRAAGIVSGASTPIRCGDGLYGMLQAHSTSARRFSAEEVAFLESVASVLGAAADRAAAEDRIRHHAMYDWLTGLPNRVLFNDRVAGALAAAQRHGRTVALVFIDLDNFKNINDSLGHGHGDKVLRCVAKRLAEQIRPDDTLARLGGDEFAVLLPEIDSSADGARIAERLLAALGVPLELDGGPPMVIGASIGIAIAGGGAGATGELLERNADLAMYAAKNDGRGQVRFFEPSMHEEALAQLERTADLRDGVEREEFELRYQPIVAAGGGAVVAIEALVRWRHPRHGLLSPADFIALAEDTGLIVPIGRLVLYEACMTLARWRRQSIAAEHVAISVNVSTKQLHCDDFVADVARVLAETGLPAANLILEITETLLIRGNGIDHQLDALHAMGVRLAVDDFGTGYSALSYLHHYPFDILKIDRSFVERLGVDAGADQIVRGIVSLAGCLSLETIAEGVETTEQADAIRAMGADMLQGFHLGRPGTVFDMERLLSTGPIDAPALSR